MTLGSSGYSKSVDILTVINAFTITALVCASLIPISEAGPSHGKLSHHDLRQVKPSSTIDGKEHANVIPVYRPPANPDVVSFVMLEYLCIYCR